MNTNKLEIGIIGLGKMGGTLPMQKIIDVNLTGCFLCSREAIVEFNKQYPVC